MQLKSVLLMVATSLSVGCVSGSVSLPPEPVLIQYGIHSDVKPGGFYGVNNKTSEYVYKAFLDAEMKAGQCLSAADYQKYQEWVDVIKEIAIRRCR